MDERLTAWDNLSIYADLYGVPRAESGAGFNELLVEFDLADRAQEKVGATAGDEAAPGPGTRLPAPAGAALPG